MPLPQFKNEAEFRDNWIRPFLTKLGYIHVHNIHGTGEQGKDFFFADYDRFNHLRFNAVQAKIGKLGVGRVLTELLGQVDRSFTVKLRFHKDAHERRVSAVYIMTSGSVSREAREHIFDWAGKQDYRENVYCLDGETLDRLERQFIQAVDRELLNQLSGVLAECHSNDMFLDSILALLETKQTPLNRTRNAALERVLSVPPPADLLDFSLMEAVWQTRSTFNAVCDLLAFSPPQSEERWAERVAYGRTAQALNKRLLGATKKAIYNLQSRYNLSVEVVE